MSYLTIPFENKSICTQKRDLIPHTFPESEFLLGWRNSRHGFESKLGLIGYKIMQTTWRNDTVIVNQENFHQTSSNFTAGEWKTTEPKPSHYEKTKIRFIDFYTRRQLKYRPVRVRNQVPIPNSNFFKDSLTVLHLSNIHKWDIYFRCEVWHCTSKLDW